MLRGIPSILSPDLLHALRAMGHGDELVIGDSNFPGESAGPPCIRLDGISATDVLQAVVALFPLDTFVEANAFTMDQVDAPGVLPPVVQEFQAIIDSGADNPKPIQPIERFAFYERASRAFAVIITGEDRPYGNIILTKGVVFPAP